MRQWIRSATAVVLGGALLAGCGTTATPAPPPDRVEVGAAGFSVSYAEAAGRLAGLEPTEARAQVEDWARVGLASALKLDTARVRDAMYDAVPVRDGGFADLSRQSTGPGRALFDGKVLHLLVAADDPHRSRTIGQLLDQHRTDAGGDPDQVRLHDYTVHTGSTTIDITSEAPVSADEARSANGYVSTRIDDAAGLTGFLARTRYLSTVETRGTEVWAGGWTWQDGGASLDVADVAVLQRGYRQAGAQPTPGFSLDAGPPPTEADLVAAVPGLTPDVAARVLSGDWSGSGFRSADEVADAVGAALHGDGAQPADLGAVGLPTTREGLWGLQSALTGQPVYSQARYDGGLAGTSIGMTLFYTDYVAKNWANGVGGGVPAKAVEGFVPATEAVTPWSHCTTGTSGESGRLWFGQNESAYAYDGQKFSIGAQAVRLFARSDGAEAAEVEPSFAFGRGLKWWDQHYQAVADYEPQYQRLDQIMRWSGALEWLVAKTSATLPAVVDAKAPANPTFADWYARNSDLRERSPIPFVTPPSATQEAVPFLPSKSFASCGYQWIYGGVSLGDLISRKGGRDYRADLPKPVGRAGLVDEGSTFDAAGGTGHIDRLSIDSANKVVDSLRHEFTVVDGKAVVAVDGAERQVVQLGGLKVVLPASAHRKLSTVIDAHDGHVSQRVDYQGSELGELTADQVAGRVTITWRRGVVDRARSALDSLQDRLSGAFAGGVPSAKDGVLYAFQDPSGRVLSRVGGPDDPWLTIGADPPSGGGPGFRLGAPSPSTGEVRFFYGSLVDGPNPPPDAWMDVAPATADHAATVTFTGEPEKSTRTVRVTLRDGSASTAYLPGDHVVVPVVDPILGPNGLAAGAAVVREMPRVRAAQDEAAQAEDGLWREVGLGDGEAALVNEAEVRLVSRDDPWASKVLQAVDTEASRQVLVRLKDDHAVLVDKEPFAEVSGAPAERVDLGSVVDRTGVDVYLHESFRARLSVEDGRVTGSALPRDTKVTVRQAALAKAALPQSDVRVSGGAEWLRVDVPPFVTGANPSPASTPAAIPSARPGTTTAPKPSTGGLVLLVCPDTGDSLVGCDD